MLADGSTGNIPPEWELFGTQFIREIGVDSGGSQTIMSSIKSPISYT